MSTTPITAKLDFPEIVEVDLPELSDQEKRTEEAALGALGHIKLFWYHILYFFYQLLSEKNDAIFEHNISLIPTHNFAKKEELKNYALLSDTEIPELSKVAGAYGFYSSSKVKIAPMGMGVCFGGVLHFFDSAGANGVEKAAEEFRGGMPIQAAIYQSFYNELHCIPPNEEMRDLLIFAIDNAHAISASRLKEYWTGKFGERTLPVLNAIHDYIAEGHDPKDGGLLKAVQNALLLQNKSLKGLYETIREVEEHYLGKPLYALDQDRLMFLFAGLEIEPVCFDDSPGKVIESLTNLEPGRYCLGLTVYTPIGSVGGHHATGFVINENGTFHFLDPNFAVGQIPKEHLQSTISKVFKTYTGIATFSGNSGKKEAVWRRFCNFFQLNPNASPEVDSGFTLYKVMEASL